MGWDPFQATWTENASGPLGTTGTYQVTIAHKSPGNGGNQQVLALDASQVPAGCSVSVLGSDLGTPAYAAVWQAGRSRSRERRSG